jgi:di/tricarboxylate transporter
MTVEIVIVLSVIVIAVILFATEKLPIDLVALSAMAFLMVTGIITPEEGISGFSNTATITVGAMFVISAALFRTGLVNMAGMKITELFKYNFWIGITVTMIAAGIFSAFINNTPVVAIFIPIMLSVSMSLKISSSKLLMPLSFASMFGGVCTLIGTSTNILVSSISEKYTGISFSMFEFAPLGLVFFTAGIFYMLFFGIKKIPDRRGDNENLLDSFGMGEYITEIILNKDSISVGKQIQDSPIVKDLDISILKIRREGKEPFIPRANSVLNEGDILIVRCDFDKIKRIQEREGIEIKPIKKHSDQNLEDEETALIEAIISPTSFLIGRSLKSTQFRSRYGGIAIAIRHSGKIIRENLGSRRLRAGDALLIELNKNNLQQFRESNDFVFINELITPVFKKKKIIPSVLIIASFISLAALDIIPILTGAIIGCILLVLIGTISLVETYRSIEWNVIFLLAGALALGTALEKTGAALYLSNLLIDSFGSLGPVALVIVFYLLTTLLTESMSNNATAVLLAPIAITTAESLGISAKPLLMAVTFAASASFITPVGYQTNTMIYGAGQYKFIDFVKVGGPLNLIFLILAAIFIPIFFPF